MKNENYQPLLGSVGAIDNSLWLRRITKHNPWTFFQYRSPPVGRATPAAWSQQLVTIDPSNRPIHPQRIRSNTTVCVPFSEERCGFLVSPSKSRIRKVDKKLLCKASPERSALRSLRQWQGNTQWAFGPEGENSSPCLRLPLPILVLKSRRFLVTWSWNEGSHWFVQIKLSGSGDENGHFPGDITLCLRT